MHQYHNINQGKYLVQSGYRNNTAIIQCPYIPQKIQVYQAQSLKILHGASVYWTQIRRIYPIKRKGTQQIIIAVVVGIKNCQYIYKGKQFLCSIKIKCSQSQTKIIGIPVDKKLPCFQVNKYSQIINKNLNQKQIRQKYQQRYYWARFQQWNYDDTYPKGSLIGTFKKSFKTPEIQSQILLYKMEINQNNSQIFHPRILLGSRQYLPVKNHRQISQVVFTIDPAGAQDVEDALSIQPLQQGFYQIGVHISDVTSFSNHVNRKEISQRGTSIYLPHKTIHMMPNQLINLMALLPNKRRLAFSVFFKIDIDGNIYQSRFQKTIVKSSAKLSYQQAQDLIQQKNPTLKQSKFINEETTKIIGQKLKILRKIALNRRKIRNTSQLFDKNQIVFQLDQRNIPINIGSKLKIQSQKIVEQFMIMTNSEVAKKLVKDFGHNSLIIYHPKPLDINIGHLNHYLSGFGITFQPESISHLQNQFKKLFQDQKIDDSLRQLLIIKAIQIQQFAVYTRYQNIYKGHYGLNLDFYTHFTSPIRRFADQIVHQQLQRCINKQQYKSGQLIALDKQIQLVNKARVRNKKLKQQIVQCFLNLHLHHLKTPLQTKGFILKLGLKSATVYLPRFNLIKDIPWRGNTDYNDKDSVSVKIDTKEGKKLYKFQKNQCLNMLIINDIHQQVELFILKKQQNNIIRI